MKNLIAFTISATLLLFTACTKDTTELPRTSETSTIEGQNLEVKTTLIDDGITGLQINDNIEGQSTTIKIQVNRVTNSQVSGEYLVEFSAAYDFTAIDLETVQYLKFTDANNNESTLSFSLNNSFGSNGTLEAAYSIGGNDLTGLELALTQEIIIEDFVHN